MKHYYYAEYDNTVLKPLEGDDIESLRSWRNDKTQTRFLRNIGTISKEQQIRWYKDYLEDKSQIIFAIYETKELKELVGSLAIYDIDWDKKTAEIGKIQIGVPEAHGKGIGRKALVMAMRIGFLYLGLDKIVGSVHPDNVQAHTNDMKIGFKVVGKMPSTVGGFEDLIEITERDASLSNHYYYFIETEDKSKCANEFYIGKEGRFSKTITETDIVNFAGITGDFNPVHINKIAAEKSIFGKQVAHGMLTSSFFSTVIGMVMPGPGTVYLKQNSTFVRPTYVGDTITSIVSIKTIKDRNKANLKTTIVNQKGQVLVSGNAEVLLPVS